jgi:hypothetical protein
MQSQTMICGAESTAILVPSITRTLLMKAMLAAIVMARVLAAMATAQVATAMEQCLSCPITAATTSKISLKPVSIAAESAVDAVAARAA